MRVDLVLSKVKLNDLVKKDSVIELHIEMIEAQFN
jgi:hypothetical protein